MEDKEASGVAVRKLTLLADYYASVSPAVARYFMFEAETVKADLDLPATRSSQVCQYCCTLWRPARQRNTSHEYSCTNASSSHQGMMSQSTDVKLVNRRNRASRVRSRKSKTASNLTNRKFDPKIHQILICSVCGGETSAATTNSSSVPTYRPIRVREQSTASSHTAPQQQQQRPVTVKQVEGRRASEVRSSQSTSSTPLTLLRCSTSVSAKKKRRRKEKDSPNNSPVVSLPTNNKSRKSRDLLQSLLSKEQKSQQEQSLTPKNQLHMFLSSI